MAAKAAAGAPSALKAIKEVIMAAGTTSVENGFDLMRSGQLTGDGTSIPKHINSPVEALRHLLTTRRTLIKSASQMIKVIESLPVTAPDPATAAKHTLRLLARDYQHLHTEADDLEDRMTKLVATSRALRPTSNGGGRKTGRTSRSSGVSNVPLPARSTTSASTLSSRRRPISGHCAPRRT
ncbi:hypothetical protein [Brevibacterium aurantiacum]|uniref:hypothetical protein n=1 Tax=Brevibacterium aurantiacum TaxID=273384 RepID=UPI0011AF08A7|nr:hypothetical protein [Brevibacterium aurantiacum]